MEDASLLVPAPPVATFQNLRQENPIERANPDGLREAPSQAAPRMLDGSEAPILEPPLDTIKGVTEHQVGLFHALD